MFKIVASILLFASTPALAIDPAYLGFWVSNPSQCHYREWPGQFKITPKGREEQESSCSTRRASRDGSAWVVRLSCSGEGEIYKLSLRWELTPDGRLRETRDGKVHEYVRCK
jgi:hypothetical protein